MRTKEEIKEYQKQYRIKNKDKIAERYKNWYPSYEEANREVISAKNSERYYKNKEANTKRSKEYYQKVKLTQHYKDRKRNDRIMNSKEYTARVKKWGENHPDRKRNSKLKSKYGITLVEYDAIYLRQGGRCLGCGIHQDDMPKALSIDHCHKTKKVRGLLCDKCNFIIGLADENATILQSLIKYLKDYE
jgi:hypothetical protein